MSQSHTIPSTTRPVNEQITDSVTQNAVQVVGEAAAMSMGMLYQIGTQTSGLSMQNAVHGQQSMNQISTAVVAASVNKIMSVPDLRHAHLNQPPPVNSHKKKKKK